tara:strand:+ start:3691 stop:4797 length:1107 start_codon:yes stop_codon:yes gene_type:complete
MEFTVSKMMLFNALSHFQSVVEKRNTIPILSNVKVKTHSNKIEITATDLALEITEVIDAKVIQEGELTVPSQMFFDIIRKAPEKCIIEIKQDLDLGQMFIFFGDSKFSLSYLPTSDFPQMENESLENIISISSQDFSYLIDDTKFSMGLDESRQYLNGIYFHQTEGFLTCVATDGHRLSRCQIIKDADLKNFDGIIIPKKTVYEISKILEGSDEILEVSFSKTKIQLKIDKIKITSKLLSANFPDYESVIPKDNNLIMITDCIAFAETIDRVSTVSAEKFRTVKLDISEDKCVVSSFGQEKSAGTEQIKVKYSGPSININFNAKYILDVLNIFKSGEISFTFSESTAPTTLKSTKKKNSLYLIMQMRS